MVCIKTMDNPWLSLRIESKIILTLFLMNIYHALLVARHDTNLSFGQLTYSERRPQNIYSQEEMNLYYIIKLAT